MIKRTFIISFVLSLALFAWLFVLLVNIVGRGTNTSDHWIHKSIQYKRALAEAIHEPKIVVIGGSEALFSTDSELLSQQTGMPVVNMATHIGIPLRLYPNILEGTIRKGDVVVYSLAFDGQHNCGEEKLYSSLVLPMYWNGLCPEMQSALSLIELAGLYLHYGLTWISDSLKIGPSKRQRPSRDILEEYSRMKNEKKRYYGFYTLNAHGDKLYVANSADQQGIRRDHKPPSCDVTEEFLHSIERRRHGCTLLRRSQQKQSCCRRDAMRRGVFEMLVQGVGGRRYDGAIDCELVAGGLKSLSGVGRGL